MSLTPAEADTLRLSLATAVVVPVTPFQAGGDPDWDTYAALISRLIANGITVITPNGNTGEFYALSQAEARQALETAAKAADGRVPLLAGVGHDIATATEAARHARDHGARMILIHQPVHPYVSAEGWIDYHAAIADAVPDLGVVLYIRNERITGQHIAALARRSPNVLGVKYAVRDATRFAAVARDGGLDQLTWLAGAAELTAPAFWAVGARGFTSGLANVNPGLALDLLRALQADDFDRRDDHLGSSPPVRGAPAGRRQRRQRERGQGGPGPAGPVPRRRPPAQPPRCRSPSRTRSPASSKPGTWREQPRGAAQLPLVRRRADLRAAGLQPPLPDAPAGRGRR